MARLMPVQIPGCNCSISESILPFSLTAKFSGVAVIAGVTHQVGVRDGGIGVDDCDGIAVAVVLILVADEQATRIGTTNKLMMTDFTFIFLSLFCLELPIAWFTVCFRHTLTSQPWVSTRGGRNANPGRHFG